MIVLVARTEEDDMASRRSKEPEGQQRGEPIGWTLLSSHGRVLFYIALNPAKSVAEIARGLGLTTRQVWKIVRDLRRANMVHGHRENRRLHFSVSLDAPFLHPTISGITLKDVLGSIARTSPDERSRICADPTDVEAEER